MPKKTLTSLGATVGVGLLVSALWTWANSDPLALRWATRDAALCLRFVAVSLAAAGEASLVLLVLGNVWRRDRLTDVLALSAALVFVLSATGAVALGLAGR